MINYLVDLVGRAGHWAYGIFFLGAMLECAAFLGVAVPGEWLVLFGGFLASQQALDLDVLIATVCLGAIVGDTIGYELGRLPSRNVLLHYGRWAGVTEARLNRAESFFRRHGGKTVFIGRFVGFLRAFAPFLAGSFGMTYWRFLLYNALGAVLWSSVFALVGYWAGESWRAMEGWIGKSGAILAGLLGLFLGTAWLWRWTVRHETQLRERWCAFLEWPRIERWRRRFAPQLRFLQNRLSPAGYLGLHLTVGAIVIVFACWWFGGVVEDLLTHDPLVVVDQRVADWFNRHATLSSYSFPSGHTMGATLFYLFLAFTVFRSVCQWRWRVLAVLVMLLLVFLIGLTRIYLGAHYLSDVMGAMAAGLAWLAFCLTAVETLRRYQEQE